MLYTNAKNCKLYYDKFNKLQIILQQKYSIVSYTTTNLKVIHKLKELQDTLQQN